MKRIISTMVLACAMAMPGLSHGAEGVNPLGVYVGGHLGMSMESLGGRKTTETWNDSMGMGITGTEHWRLGGNTSAQFGGGLALGYNFKPQLNVPVRLELNYTARTQASAKGTTTATGEMSTPSGSTAWDERVRQKDTVGLQTLMLNGMFDIPTGTNFTPYVGAGIGFGFIQHKSRFCWVDDAGIEDGEYTSMSQNRTNFAWSLGAGLAYDITKNWTVDLGYRYINAGSSKASHSESNDFGTSRWNSKVSVQAHDVMLGVRYTF